MTITIKQMMVTLWTAALSGVSSRNFDNFRQYKLLKQWEKIVHFSHVASSQRPFSLLSPPSSNDTFISQNLFPLSWLAAPFPSFCVGTKFSSEATVIVFHLGRLKALQASPGGTGGDGKTGRRTENQGRGQGPRIRGQSTMMLRSAVRGLKSISRFIISLHTFRLRYAVIHAATIEGLFFYHVSLNCLTPLPLQPQLFRKNTVLLSFLLWMLEV